MLRNCPQRPVSSWHPRRCPCSRSTPLPQKVTSGAHARNRRVTAALDLLLTSDTVLQAADRTRKRLDDAGEATPATSAPPEESGGAGPSSPG